MTPKPEVTQAPAADAGEGRGIPMILHCPRCQLQHIDEPDERTPEWDNPPHRSHLCHGCGCIWRPADVATEGVAAIKTAGKADTAAVLFTSVQPAAPDFHETGGSLKVLAGMKPWHGGDSAPADWGGGEVRRRDGSKGVGRRWRHDFSYDDIIAYTPTPGGENDAADVVMHHKQIATDLPSVINDAADTGEGRALGIAQGMQEAFAVLMVSTRYDGEDRARWEAAHDDAEELVALLSAQPAPDTRDGGEYSLDVALLQSQLRAVDLQLGRSGDMPGRVEAVRALQATPGFAAGVEAAAKVADGVVLKCEDADKRWSGYGAALGEARGLATAIRALTQARGKAPGGEGA